MSDSSELIDLTPGHVTVDNSITRKAKDIAAGFIGGATQVLIGQPADLVKIRLQTSSQSSSLSIIKQVIKNEGLLAFYKGTLAPLFGVGVCVSLQFYGFHEAKRQIVGYYNQKDLNLWPQTYIAGAVAGIVNTPVAGPIEQLRILSQSNTSATKNSLIETVKKIYATEGVVNGIYRGFSITLLREIQAYGVWFLTYEYLISQIIDLQHYKSRNDISTPELLVSGALAGNALWLSSYPIDVIKSNIQSDKFGAESKFNGKIGLAVNHIFKTHGFRGFWRGIVPCLLRAVPCSAGTFASVELALRLMG
ncbi:mitochondrial carrier protein [Scheffersomyces xylosifermentans]|uniref:mitochondrial carrier protein n=1 Tax=Scheffersomyces xylosifermentans TaxID=1304137 RepID=UPI00315DE232